MSPRLPASLEPLLFALLLSGMMSALVTGIATGQAVGRDAAWGSAWLLAWGTAFPSVLIVAPLTRRLVSNLTAPRLRGEPDSPYDASPESIREPTHDEEVGTNETRAPQE